MPAIYPVGDGFGEGYGDGDGEGDGSGFGGCGAYGYSHRDNYLHFIYSNSSGCGGGYSTVSTATRRKD